MPPQLGSSLGSSGSTLGQVTLGQATSSVSVLSGISSAEAFGVVATRFQIVGAGGAPIGLGASTNSQLGASQLGSPSSILGEIPLGRASTTDVSALVGIPTAEVFGVVSYKVTVILTGIPSAEAFGRPPIGGGGHTYAAWAGMAGLVLAVLAARNNS